MDAVAPTVLDIPVRCAPKKAPCPTCGRLAKRVRTGQREVRTIAYRRVARLQITYGEYQASCACCTTFRTSPDGVLPRAGYDNKVRQAVLDRIIDDGMNVEATLRSLGRDFLLDLSTGFVYDCLHDAVARLDMAEHRRQVIREFSGTLCVDELHLGHHTLLLATDPIRDMPVAFALVSADDGEHMRRFLSNLRSHGLNRKVLDAVKRLRRALSRRGNSGRRRRCGRPSKTRQRERRKQQRTLKDKANFVFRHRHLIVKSRENLSEQDREDLATMLGDVPELGVLRDFADALPGLFEVDRSEHQAWCRWGALRRNAKYQGIPELKEALGLLEESKFGKVIAYLRSPASRGARTNNHVERCNRKLRYWEKVRYKWRRRRSLVRFVVLALDHWWKKVLNSPRTPETETTGQDEPTTRGRHTPTGGSPTTSRRKTA